MFGRREKFQLTRSRGARLVFMQAFKPIQSISTHALTWSATRFSTLFRRWSSDFNSRAHVERDAYEKTIYDMAGNFNSRAHVERDKNNIEMFGRREKFQLTRSRGARRKWRYFRRRGYNFNSRAHVERDRGSGLIWQQQRNFNSRAHVERDAICYSAYERVLISTHALTWSATRVKKRRRAEN